MKKKLIAVIIIVVVLGGCGLGMKIYHDKQIEKMHNEGIAKVEKLVDLKDYRKTQQGEIRDIIDASTEKISAAKDQTEVDEIIQDASDKIKKIKTDAQLTEKMHQDAVSKLESVVDIKDYREAQQNEIRDIIKAATEKIQKAKKKADADAIVSEASEQLASVKTDAQLTQEEAAAAARAAQNAKKSSSKKSSGSNSGGCIGNDAKNLY